MPTWPGVPFAVDLSELSDEEIAEYSDELRKKIAELCPENVNANSLAVMYALGIGGSSTTLHGIMIEILRISTYMYNKMFNNLNDRLKMLEEMLEENAEDIPWEDAI